MAEEYYDICIVVFQRNVKNAFPTSLLLPQKCRICHNIFLRVFLEKLFPVELLRSLINIIPLEIGDWPEMVLYLKHFLKF